MVRYPLRRIAVAPASVRRHGLNLFLVGFLVLFLELACIRWFSAYVIFLQFFTNVVLIASFLGMSCGCLAVRQQRNWLGDFPLIALGAIALAILTLVAYGHWSGLHLGTRLARAPATAATQVL